MRGAAVLVLLVLLATPVAPAATAEEEHVLVGAPNHQRTGGVSCESNAVATGTLRGGASGGWLSLRASSGCGSVDVDIPCVKGQDSWTCRGSVPGGTAEALFQPDAMWLRRTADGVRDDLSGLALLVSMEGTDDPSVPPLPPLPPLPPAPPIPPVPPLPPLPDGSPADLYYVGAGLHDPDGPCLQPGTLLVSLRYQGTNAATGAFDLRSSCGSSQFSVGCQRVEGRWSCTGTPEGDTATITWTPTYETFVYERYGTLRERAAGVGRFVEA